MLAPSAAARDAICPALTVAQPRPQYHLPDMKLGAGVRLGAYEIVGPIGAGGMGEVYRARHARLAREVAIKVLPARLSDDALALARFEREAKAVAALSHPSILAIFDFGVTDGVAYAVTELLAGDTLRARLAEGPLPVRRVVECAIQIAEGLGAAHDKGIVHRDLKPDNLFLTNDARIKILDFGLARQTTLPGPEDTSSPTVSRHTEPGTVLGTVGYMSPEQVRGLTADERSDVFSFGAVLYEMLSGRRAFKGDSAAETMHAILKDDPPDLLETNPGLPPALDRIVHHCLEKRPEQRFQSAHDMAFDLQALSASSGATAALRARGAIGGKRALGMTALLATAVAIGALADRALRKPAAVDQPTYHRLTFDRGEVGTARFAPDGNTIVYNAAWRGEPTEVFTRRLDSRESRALGLRGATLHAISSESELAVGLHALSAEWNLATLARVPLAGGSPREVVERIPYADWSPDGTELAVVRVLEASQRVEFPIGRVVYETKGSLTHVRVSPQGDWLAFIEHPVTSFLGAGSLVAVDRNGAKRVLAEEWADMYGIARRPDGREVWFTAARSGEFKALRAVTLDGKERLVARLLGQIDLQDIGRDGRVLLTRPDFRCELHALPPGASKERDITWLGLSGLADLSADGDHVLFTEFPEGGAKGGFTYLRRTDGSPAVRLGEGQALALSPDGKWALAWRTSSSQLVLLPTGVGEAQTLSVPATTSVAWGAWFPDSRRVLFAAETNGRFRIYVRELGGGETRPIGPPEFTLPSSLEAAEAATGVSPDGRTLVAAGHDGVVLLAVESGQLRPCPGSERGDRPVRWSADGRSLFVLRYKGFAAQVHRLELTTGRRTLLRELAPPDPAGAGFPDVRVTPDGKSYAYSFIRNLNDLYLVDGLK
jgi:Tol biopolymer transport system component